MVKNPMNLADVCYLKANLYAKRFIHNKAVPKSNLGAPSCSKSSVACSRCCSENLRSCCMKRSMEVVKLRSLLFSQWTTNPPLTSSENRPDPASAAGISNAREKDQLLSMCVYLFIFSINERMNKCLLFIKPIKSLLFHIWYAKF